ncbi:MAG: GNAT family N-acetyltransferase [Candidatus Heimdallarchaeota archaeon]|nr:GNAT family N-acetyltransferase [Candidatus Heimdallarchaeota archaeon]MDH5644731.1 GNAT family N-acetyltransferase [Candidatus Heimdallarchaeota archaeon]
MEMYSLETNRLYLNRLAEEQIPKLLEYWNSPELRYITIDRNTMIPEGNHPYTVIYNKNDILDIFKIWDNSSKYRSFGIFTKKENEIIGHITYDYSWDPFSIILNLLIYPKYRNQGYAKEVTPFMIDEIFNTLVTHNIAVFIDEDETNAMKFAEYLGFKSTGVIKHEFYRGGKLRNTHCYDILRPEWRNTHAT